MLISRREREGKRKRDRLKKNSVLIYFLLYLFFSTPEEDGVNADGFAWITVTDVIKSGVYLTSPLPPSLSPSISFLCFRIEPKRRVN